MAPQKQNDIIIIQVPFATRIYLKATRIFGTTSPKLLCRKAVCNNYFNGHSNVDKSKGNQMNGVREIGRHKMPPRVGRTAQWIIVL